MIADPLIVLPLPLIVAVPAPPGRCVNDPAPVVERFPAIVRLVPDDTDNPAPLTTTLLKLLVPAPLIDLFEPLKLTVPAPPAKDPSFVQFPAIVWVKEPPVNVVEDPRVIFPFTVMAAPAVNETETAVPTLLAKFPAIVMALTGIVLLTAPALPFSVRLPYN